MLISFPRITALVMFGLLANTALAQQFKTVDESPAGGRFETAANFDILGIRPGATIEEIKAILADAFPDDGAPNEIRLTGNAANNAGAQVAIDYVSEVRRGTEPDMPPLYLTGKAADYPRIYFASAVYGNRAIGVMRNLYFDKNETMSADAMRIEIEKKYGKPTFLEKTYDGFAKEMVYFYAGGKVVHQTTHFFDHIECSQDPKTGVNDCGSYTEEFINVNHQSVTARTAKEPCAAFHRTGSFLEYDYNARPVVNDPACDGILKIDFIGGAAKLERVQFWLEDVKRSYGHKTAFDKAIDQALSAGVGRTEAPKPKL